MAMSWTYSMGYSLRTMKWPPPIRHVEYQMMACKDILVELTELHGRLEAIEQEAIA
jgi:hypothetical protein